MQRGAWAPGPGHQPGSGLPGGRPRRRPHAPSRLGPRPPPEETGEPDTWRQAARRDRGARAVTAGAGGARTGARASRPGSSRARQPSSLGAVSCAGGRTLPVLPPVSWDTSGHTGSRVLTGRPPPGDLARTPGARGDGRAFGSARCPWTWPSACRSQTDGSRVW